MKKVRDLFYYFVFAISILVIIGSVLSLWRDTDSRYLKILDFPRIQFFIASILSLLFFGILTKNWQKRDYFLIVGLLAAMLIQISYLVNYTPLVRVEVPTYEGIPDADDKLSLLLANVRRDNREYQALLDLIDEKNPDLIVAMEVNDWWNKQMAPIKKDYPYTKASVNNLGYGMTFYSKFPLKESVVNHLHNERVPSFSSTITLRNGKNIRIHTLHPPPPLHYTDVPDNENQQEMAMIKVGDKVMDSSLPNIVAGDFNDVAWSATNKMTKSKGQLKDVRVGRGFYNSFDASNIFLRWPLDHVFVTKEFSLSKIERLPSINSDHFPIFVELVLLK